MPPGCRCCLLDRLCRGVLRRGLVACGWRYECRVEEDFRENIFEALSEKISSRQRQGTRLRVKAPPQPSSSFSFRFTIEEKCSSLCGHDPDSARRGSRSRPGSRSNAGRRGVGVGVAATAPPTFTTAAGGIAAVPVDALVRGRHLRAKAAGQLQLLAVCLHQRNRRRGRDRDRGIITAADIAIVIVVVAAAGRPAAQTGKRR